MKPSPIVRLFATFLATLLLASCTTGTSAHVRGGGGATLTAARAEPYDGPKARVAVAQFVDKSAKGGGTIGTGMADMLTTALFGSDRFILLDRQDLDAIISEQDFAASDRMAPLTEAAMGEIEGVDLMIFGAITEFEPESIGAGGIIIGIISLGASVAIASNNDDDTPIGIVTYKDSHVALDIKIVDAKTSRVVATTSVTGEYRNWGGGLVGGVGGGWSRSPITLGGWAGTGVEEALRVAIEKAVVAIVANTPVEYYRIDDRVDMTPAGRLVSIYPVVLPPGTSGFGAGSEPQSKIIATQEEYESLLQKLSVDSELAPVIDWDQHKLVAVFAGEQPRKGFLISVIKAIHRDDYLEVFVGEAEGPPVPDNPEVTDLGPSYPFDLVRIVDPKKEIRFTWLQ